MALRYLRPSYSSSRSSVWLSRSPWLKISLRRAPRIRKCVWQSLDLVAPITSYQGVNTSHKSPGCKDVTPAIWAATKSRSNALFGKWCWRDDGGMAQPNARPTRFFKLQGINLIVQHWILKQSNLPLINSLFCSNVLHLSPRFLSVNGI